MNYKKIFNVVGVVAVAVVFSVGCNKPEDPPEEPVIPAVTPTPTKTDFTDVRDGKTYKKVTIGKQTWMAENLNYEAGGSKCYNNSADSCAKYGRLYDWNTAMNGASSSSLSPSGVQGVCPAGWHIPSDDEWTALMSAVGGASTAGTKLKSTSGWNDYQEESGNGTDQYGFSALPVGTGNSTGFGLAGNTCYWWSATDCDAGCAWSRSMDYNRDYVNRGSSGNNYLMSVRCLQD
jgi:uncharacterized protein (TIGR02145 family)